ncbi:armadillo-type protein [Roridomyces roridus]|uniref:Armadillo-type protein n=1 Tax=Roridomyces roridus TaxID=1738132 RepID=A0AAD7CFQ2_9AGAR|nr:armadillo-type protein [Roridomyces roridus]
MEIPFISSGALSRAHYILVSRVESAASPEISDSYLLKEVETTRARLRHPSLSLKDTRECLVILLYCFMSINSAALPSSSLDFALPQAVNLAEAGRKGHEKRIGYLFCAEIMSPNHELRLMLVNTLRKDLESSTTSLVCLALDNLIASPSEDVIPAVQSRLHDLLSNPSSHVRRRALLACSALSHLEPDLLRRIASKVLKRLRDTDAPVVCAALSVCVRLYKVHEATRLDVEKAVNELLQLCWSDRDKSRAVLLKILSALRSVPLLTSSFALIFEIIRTTSGSSDHPVMCAAFHLLSDANPEDLKNYQPSPAAMIRELLTSRSVNDQYIFLSCLSCLDPQLWAGTNVEIPAVLDEWEVGRVMELLDSADMQIRQKTLKILNRIDLNIVPSYYSQALRTLPDDLGIGGVSKYVCRLLEVVEIQTEGDGELYAHQLNDLFAQMEARSPRYAQHVLESAVEMVLLHLRNAPTSFQVGCATNLVTSLATSEVLFGQTMMVIISALATEYSGKLSVAPPDVLRGLSSRLPLCQVAVQDACLLAMLRISFECDQVPSEVFSRVKDLSEQSGRHIRERCEEFISFAAQKGTLEQIIRNTKSSSLPDFLQALNSHRNYDIPPTDAPVPTAPLRGRASSNGSSRSGSSQLEEFVAATHLSISKTRPTEIASSSAADLIAFNESPFISDPAADFESIWNALEDSSGARGWCDATLEDVIKQLEDMEAVSLKVISAQEPPFIGEDKILLNGAGVLRMRSSEDGGYLWRLRCEDSQLRIRVKGVLE